MYQKKKMTESAAQKQQTVANRVLIALRDVLYSARSQGYEPESRLIKRHRKYAEEINFARSKDGKARAIAKHIIPNEDKYKEKITEYPSYYKGELLTNLLKLLELLREIALAPPPAPKEKRIPTKNEVDDFMTEVFGKMKLDDSL